MVSCCTLVSHLAAMVDRWMQMYRWLIEQGVINAWFLFNHMRDEIVGGFGKETVGIWSVLQDE